MLEPTTTKTNVENGQEPNVEIRESSAKLVFTKKPCKYCKRPYDIRGLPQHERWHERQGSKTKKRVHKILIAQHDAARLERNRQARLTYARNGRKKPARIMPANKPIATLQSTTQQLPDNARAIRIAMLYLIKKDTDNATD